MLKFQVIIKSRERDPSKKLFILDLTFQLFLSLSLFNQQQQHQQQMKTKKRRDNK